MLSEKQKQKLLKLAAEARAQAYAPYSKYAVGAALLADNGKYYSGANIENAAYPSSMCAERVAIFKAVSEGVRRLQGLAVVTINGGSPCGGCRQVICEFAQQDLSILIGNIEGKLILETTLAELLPHSFGPEDLT